MENVKSALKTNLNTKSFTLFEVLISLVILSVALIALLKLSSQSDDLEIYSDLQELQNNYYENKTVEQTEQIRFH
jgi:Tfp pilus assembly protein PilV